MQWSENAVDAGIIVSSAGPPRHIGKQADMAEASIPDTRFPVLEVSGTPREMGRQLGEAMRDELRGLIEIIVERINKGRPGRLAFTYEQGLEVAAASVAPAEAYAPHLVEELRGVAEAGGVSLEQVMLINVRNQIATALEGACTSVAVEAGASSTGTGMVAQNWDNDPAADPFSLVLTRRPDNGPAHLNFTQPGVIGYMGLNEPGIGICVNTLPAPALGRGVPWYFQLRSIYEESGLDGAVAQVARADLAISINAAMMTPEGAADIEATASDLRVLRANERGTLVHTNHCVHADLVPINDDFPELIESGPRLRRSEALLAKMDSPVSLDDLKRLLSDHDGFPRSICRHPNDDPETGFWRSVVSMILEPSEGRMHLSRGNPCERPFEVYALD